MVYVVMGVCGCGKTTVGQLLASRLGVPFFDGDDFHPAANKVKMKSGQPLTDADRAPWLSAMAAKIVEWNAGAGAVLACSALREIYRRTLNAGSPAVRFVHLKGTKETIQARLHARQGHFMPPALLDSQFATLEEPADAITVDIRGTPEEIVAQALAQISGPSALPGRPGTLFFAQGGPTTTLSSAELRAGLHAALDRLGKRKKVLIIPPDFTRFHSRAGELTRYAWEYYGAAVTDILPALGTHFAMTPDELKTMFGDVPATLFRVHDWRRDVKTLGHVPGAYLKEVSGGAVDYDWPAQVNRLLVEGGFDLILSLGQVVPHEVIGMASFNKNIFVGTGGAEGINKSHFLGAAYGMERIMGRADTPVRRVLCRAAEDFARHLPIVYAHTVVARGADGKLATRGLFVGDGLDSFTRAAALSLDVNFQMLSQPLHKVVVYLDPAEFKSTWLGNKSIYRTRMAMADGGQLIVLAPGLRQFGEDPEIDRLVRRYGYRGTPATLAAVKAQPELAANLSAAAHLIHGSSEGRFSITYCPGQLTRPEIEGVGFRHADLKDMTRRYDPQKLRDGPNTMPDGEDVFFIPNPAIGLWAYRERFRG